MEKFLKKTKGFTLIELLVVIAIIAILVVIVIVAINPVQRLADATDRRASANVRSNGTLLQTCITQESQNTNDTAASMYSTSAAVAGPPAVDGGCANIVQLQTYGTPGQTANGIFIDAAAATDVCVVQQGATSGANPHWYVYRASKSHAYGAVTVNAGVVTEMLTSAVAYPANAAARCP
jgi:prepilin-type N-terminal cleavage/methylation domain-containing protein